MDLTGVKKFKFNTHNPEEVEILLQNNDDIGYNGPMHDIDQYGENAFIVVGHKDDILDFIIEVSCHNLSLFQGELLPLPEVKVVNV